MDVVNFTGTLRENTGKKYNKQIKAQGLVPAVLYGKDLNVSFSLKPKDVKGLIYTPEFKVAHLTIDGKEYKCFIKDAQFHPVTDELVHIDFLALKEGVPVKIKVPVRITGTSPGVKSGGTLVTMIRKVEISCLPENMVDHVEVDISSLQLGDAIRIRDIKPVDGIEVLNEPATPVANVEIPRALKSAAAKVEEAQAPVV